MVTPFDALPDDIDALKALLIVERHNAIIARAQLLQAEALAAIAQAEAADVRAIIEDLKHPRSIARWRRMTLNKAVSITPASPDQAAWGKIRTWITCQWNLCASPVSSQ